MVTMDKAGKVYFSLSDDAFKEKQEIIDRISQERDLNLTAAEKKNFVRAGAYIGVPFSQLKSYLQKTPRN